jgi:hypothetical protein
MLGQCSDHQAIEVRTARNEKDIQDLWLHMETLDKRINGMKNWVIAGMVSVVVQLGILIASIVVK